jgi:hypothetical protein
MATLTEYNKIPKLSDEARKFVDAYDGGQIPVHVREELENYLKDLEPVVAQSKTRLKQLLQQAFNK